MLGNWINHMVLTHLSIFCVNREERHNIWWHLTISRAIFFFPRQLFPKKKWREGGKIELFFQAFVLSRPLSLLSCPVTLYPPFHPHKVLCRFLIRIQAPLEKIKENCQYRSTRDTRTKTGTVRILELKTTQVIKERTRGGEEWRRRIEWRAEGRRCAEEK